MLFSCKERIIKEGLFIAETGATVRSAAKAFGVSKSCVHKDVSKKLKEYDPELYARVKKVLAFNFGEKHLRGGFATKKKYEKIKNGKKRD